MRIFLSSVMRNMDDYRAAAAHALTVLGHEVKRAEDYGALPTSPQQACLTGVREADLVVILLGAEYGYVQPSGLSATHEEYREAKERHDVLAFVQKDVTRDSSQDKFVQEARDWQTGKFTADFRTPDELRDAVTSAVHNLELSRTVGPVNEAEMLERARNYIPTERNDLRDTGIYLIVVGGPKQQVLRPSDMENRDLSERLTDKAISRDVGFFTRSEGTKDQIVNNALILEQEHAAILLDEFGAVRLMHAPSDERSQSSRMMGPYAASWRKTSVNPSAECSCLQVRSSMTSIISGDSQTW